jgi:hypothetical protein
MYRYPFWVASIFSSLSTIPSIATQSSSLDLERHIRAQQLQPQFLHNNYTGLTRVVFSAKFSTTDDIVMAKMNSLSAEANNGRFIAGAVFRALHESKWTFERTLTGQPSNGTAHGQAQFHFSNQQELLYKEQGKLILPSQTPLDITQKYLYVYDTVEDLLTVYFVDEKNQRTSLFHTIHFQPKEASPLEWIANGEHLCGQDHYSASYLFAFNGSDLARFEITYQVKGPAKDYVSKTIFQPFIDDVK